MEASLHHPVFDFVSVTNFIKYGAFSENSLCYTSTVQVEKTVLLYVKYRRNEMFWNGTLNTEVFAERLMLKIKVSWFVTPSWLVEGLKGEGNLIFSIKNFYVFQMTKHNTPKD